MKRRWKWILSALVALALALGVALWSLPRYAQRFASEALAERAGVSLKAKETELTWGRIAFRDALLEDKERRARARIDELVVTFEPLASLRDPHVDALHLRGVDLLVEFPKPPAKEREREGESDKPWNERWAELERKLRGRAAQALERLSGSMPPDSELVLDDARVLLVGEEGEEQTLLRELRARLAREGEDWSLEATGSAAEVDDLTLNLVFEAEERFAPSGKIEFEGLPFALLASRVPEIPWHRPEEGIVDGHLVFEGEELTSERGFEGRLALAGVALYSERLARQPVPLPAIELVGRGSLDLEERIFELVEGRAVFGETLVELSGKLEEVGEGLVAKLDTVIPRRGCDELYRSIPDEVLGEYDGFRFGGMLAASFSASFDTRDPERTKLDFRIDDDCAFLFVPEEASVRQFERPFLHTVVEPHEQRFRMMTGPGRPEWAPLEEISPFLVQAVLAHEDAAFFRHEGFAPWAIRSALVKNWKKGRFAYGASTISMQLARNLFLRRDKLVSRKLREVLLAWHLERHLTKREILELYLNVIEYGPGVYGIRHAARHYFAASPRQLTPGHSVFLACLLPAPKRYARSFERGELTEWMEGQMRFLLEHMEKKGRIDRQALQYGLAEIQDFRFGAASRLGVRASERWAADVPQAPSAARTPPGGHQP